MLLKYLPTNLVLYLSAPYLAGETGEQALAKAHDLWRKYKFSGTIDVLGEEATSSEQCQMYVQIFRNLIDLISTYPLPVKNQKHQLTISFKPSMFCISINRTPKDFDEALQRMSYIVTYAQQKNIEMTLEAEDHRWTDFHLSAYFTLFNSGCKNLGTVIQSRLFRSIKDIQRFGQGNRVRLVTGIYQESSQIAYTKNKPMKESLIQYSRELINKGVYVELATHDQMYLRRFFTDVVLPQRTPANQFETQFLLGVPRLRLQQALTSGQYFRELHTDSDSRRSHLETLAQSGVLVRLYLPFGTGAIASPYCKRRLEHNPNLLIYGLKNLLHIS